MQGVQLLFPAEQRGRWERQIIWPLVTAALNALQQPFGLSGRLDGEIAGQKLATVLILGQRRRMIALAVQHHHKLTVAPFTPWLHRQQPPQLAFSCRPAALTLVAVGQLFQGIEQQQPVVLLLGRQPGFKAGGVVEVQPLKKLLLVEGGGPGQGLDVAGSSYLSRKCLDVDPMGPVVGKGHVATIALQVAGQMVPELVQDDAQIGSGARVVPRSP